MDALQMKMGHVTYNHPPPLSGTVCSPYAGTRYDYLCTKFEIFTFTYYKDMKGNEKCGCFGRLGVTHGHQQHSHSIEHIRLPI